uniref:Uncharacterized protein n=1 Tax=Octopus bimaculoides TaxID=37653 RepID=A0A0L8HRR2_OCTBM
MKYITTGWSWLGDLPSCNETSKRSESTLDYVFLDTLCLKRIIKVKSLDCGFAWRKVSH